MRKGEFKRDGEGLHYGVREKHSKGAPEASLAARRRRPSGGDRRWRRREQRPERGGERGRQRRAGPRGEQIWPATGELEVRTTVPGGGERRPTQLSWGRALEAGASTPTEVSWS
jgi:hypothetical protein